MLSTAHSPALDFSELQPISLEELISQAAMLTRVDRKYVLPRGEVQRIIQGLDPNTKTLVHNQKVPQAYRSTYFDTPGLTSFLHGGEAPAPKVQSSHTQLRGFQDRIP